MRRAVRAAIAVFVAVFVAVSSIPVAIHVGGPNASPIGPAEAVETNLPTWNVTDLSFSEKKSHSGDLVDVRYNDDGTKLFMLNTSYVTSYDVSTAYDTSTATVNNTYQLEHMNTAQAFDFGNNGKYLYVSDVQNGDRAVQYTFGTEYDLSTISHTRNFSWTGSNIHGLDVSNNGNAVYTNGGDLQVRKYTLSEQWNISSASSEATFDVSGECDITPKGVFVNETGTGMWTTCIANGHHIAQYEMSTAHDLSTASHVVTNGMPGDSDPESVWWKSDGTMMMFSNSSANTAVEYGQSGGSKVSGYVLDGDGNAIESADVSLNTSSTQDTTDSTGFYEFLLSDGSYKLTASGVDCRADNHTNVTVSGSDLSNQNITMSLLSECEDKSGGPGLDLNASEYQQPFVLDSHTGAITQQNSVLSVFWWEVTKVLEPENTDLEVGDRCIEAAVANGWVACDDRVGGNLEGSTEFDFDNRGEIAIYDEVGYRMEVHDKSSGGFWVSQGYFGEETVSDRPTWWWDNEFISDDVDAEEGDYVVIIESIQDIVVPENCIDQNDNGQCDVDEPYLNTSFNSAGDIVISYYDPTGETSQIEYDFTVDGEEYTFNETFDDPISNFTAEVPEESFNQGGSLDDISDVEFGFTKDGNHTIDTITFGSGGSSFGESGGGIFGPVGVSGGGSSGGGDSGGLLWLAAIIAALGWVFRKDISRQLRNIR